jgi:hypothetical protein
MLLILSEHATDEKRNEKKGTTMNDRSRNHYRPNDFKACATVIVGIVSAVAAVAGFYFVSGFHLNFYECLVVGGTAAIFSTLFVTVALAND